MVKVTTSDDTQLAVWDSGSGPPLLLVHGTTADHNRWQPVLPGFEQNFTVYTFDRRGRGESGDADVYSIEQEGRDIAAVIDWIGKPVNLLGHSFGATCCLEALLQLDNLDNLQTITLYEPALPGRMLSRPVVPDGLLKKLKALLAKNQPEDVLLTFLHRAAGVPQNQLQKMRKMPDWSHRVAAAHTIGREIDHLETMYQIDLSQFQSVEKPILLIHGGNSPVYAQEITGLLLAAFPQATGLILPGQEHIAMNVIPEEFVAQVNGFILSYQTPDSF